MANAGIVTRWCVVTYRGGLPEIAIFDTEEEARKEETLMRSEQEGGTQMFGTKPRRNRRIHVVSADYFTTTRT